MRHVGDIFEQESYRGTGIRTMSGVILTRIICSVISGVAAIGIIANFGTVTARIAIFMANLLSSWIPGSICDSSYCLFYFAIEVEIT